jgi:acyl-coenzyme A synthetase/AMP-(fatty) acid ligase
MREVFNAIRGNAICFPDRLAIALPDEQITYGELWRKVSIAWGKVNSLGLDREKPVILLIDNPIRHTIIRFALMFAGYSVAAIRREHLPLIKLLKADTAFSDVFDLKELGLNVIPVGDDWIEGVSTFIQYHPYLKQNRIGRIVFTSGSTGIPKPISISYEADEDLVKASVFGRIPGSKILLLYGLSSNGIGYLYRGLCSGSSIFFSPSNNVKEIISSHQIVEIQASPSQIRTIVEECKDSKILRKIKQVSIGSAPLAKDLQEKISRAFDCEIAHTFNSVEAMFIGICRGDLMRQREGRGNCYIPICDIQIVSELGLPLPIGEVGQIKIDSKRVNLPFDGSLEIPIGGNKTNSFISKDLGRIDPDGVLVLLGRADETINFGGAKFSPEIPEEIFKKHPLISDAGIVAVRRGNDEQEVWLALVAPNGIDLNLLRRWYAQNTSGELGSIDFDQCVQVDQIPRGFNGKVLRQQLRDKLIVMRDRLKKS